MNATNPPPAAEAEAVRADLSRAVDEGNFEEVLSILDRDAATLPASSQAGHRARALIETGRPHDALSAMEGAVDTPWLRKLRLRAYIDAGRLHEAEQALEPAGLSPAEYLGHLQRLSLASLAAGDDRAAARWGLRLRQTAEEPHPLFCADLAALVLMRDLDGLREHLALCGAQSGRSLGKALCEAARHLDDRPEADRTNLEAALGLAADARTLWLVNEGLLEEMAVPDWNWLSELVWARIAARLPSGPLNPNALPKPVPDAPTASRQMTLVADWLAVPAEERPVWHSRVFAAQQNARQLTAALLADQERRQELARNLPEVDWSEVCLAQDRGRPVILVSSHASFAYAMPLEFLRSGVNVRIISPTRRFATVPEYSQMHYPDLEGVTTYAMARRMVETLRDGGCVFVAADGQKGGARRRVVPELGVEASLPDGLWPIARRLGAQVFWIETIWREGRLSTHLSALPPPEESTGRDEMQASWHREVLTRIRAAWAHDIRNIHLNQIITRII